MVMVSDRLCGSHLHSHSAMKIYGRVAFLFCGRGDSCELCHLLLVDSKLSFEFANLEYP